MNQFYPHLLSPININGKIYKNRMGYPRAIPNIVSGALCADVLDSLGLFTANMAKNGASVVCVNNGTWVNPASRPLPPGARAPFADKSYDFNEPNTQLKMCRVIEGIHNHGSMACMSMMALEPTGWDINDLTEEAIQTGFVQFFSERAKFFKDLGFDQICIYMSYGASVLARSLSPIKNQRTDEYGGKTMTERATLTKKVFKAIRDLCGKDFVIEIQISGEEDAEGGYTADDLVEYIKAVEEYVDIVQIRSGNQDTAHPLGIDSTLDTPDTLRFAEAIKKSGANVVTAPVGGYWDPDLNEKFIAEGKCDMIYMARAFICDYEYGKKIAEGRREDITPCLRCNHCHTRPNHPDAGCFVNPKMVMDLDPFFTEEPADSVKKVAVIGGGPAGMKAALVAAQRGHDVTLFEKTDKLGGQLFHADYASFKWPLRNFKNYLAYQVGKANVDVRLNTEATPELIAAEKFDAVILAAGATHKLPPIAGVDTAEKVWLPLEVYGNDAALGKKVVVIGGAETGMETALYLAMAGHDVTVLTRQKILAHDAQPVHYRNNYARVWEKMDNFHVIVKADTVKVETGKVTYVVDGETKTVECDDVVANGGLTPCNQQAIDFAAATDYFRVVGDARYVKNVRTALKSAYTAACGI